MKQRTLCIVKPHAEKKGYTNEIASRIENSGLQISKIDYVQLTKEQAEKLYGVHKERSGYEDLIRCSTEGPCHVMVIEGKNAVKRLRELMGNIKDPDTLRGKFGEQEGDSPDWICHNAIHGSDSVENAKKEIAIFFPDED